MKLTQKGITELANFLEKKNKQNHKEKTPSYLFWKMFSLLRYLGADKIEVTIHNANWQYKKDNLWQIREEFSCGTTLKF